MAVDYDSIVTEAHPLWGRFTFNAIPYEDPILVTTAAVVAIGSIGIVGSVFYFGKLRYLWDEWLTSVDHKRIGIMYIIVSMIMLIRGFSDALLMRSQQAVAVSSESGAGYLPPEHYDQIFTAHGVIMIFFVAMGLLIGLMNIVVPLQIGARDVAFPFLNSLSFWLFVSAALLLNISLFVGEFAATGWLAGWGGLLVVGVADIRHRHLADRRQLYRDYSAYARTRHVANENAGVCVDVAVRERADCRRVSHIDCVSVAADSGSLSGYEFLHRRRRW